MNRNPVELKIGFDTSLTLSKDNFVDAVLDNEDALDQLFEAMRYDQNLTAKNVCRCALAIDIWEVVTPLLTEAYNETNKDWSKEEGAEWLTAFLPKKAPLRKDVVRRREQWILDYDGPPKVKLALELLWHWCEYLTKPDDLAGQEQLFTTLCELLKSRFEQNFL